MSCRPQTSAQRWAGRCPAPPGRPTIYFIRSLPQVSPRRTVQVFQPSLDRKHLLDVAELGFVDGCQAVTFIGLSGVPRASRG